MDVQDYFDEKADSWDALMRPDDSLRRAIATLARPMGKTVVDCACGTGVMIPYLLELGAKSVTGVDISERMTSVARSKFADDPRVTIETLDLMRAKGEYGLAVLFNCYPHFLFPELLSEKLYSLLEPDARFIVGHDCGRAELDRRHSKVPNGISRQLGSASDEARLFSKYFDVDMLADTDELFVISGKRKPAVSTQC